MENYTPNTFLNKLSGHRFDSEEALVRYFETIAPAIFEINKTRIVKELRTTSFDGTLSNLADLMILDNYNRTQALVAFEFKLDKSINNYKGGSYEDAENQLHKYCQDLNVPYGILISDKICEIFKYTYRGSIFSTEKVLCLPSLTEIEKELNLGSKPIQEKSKIDFWNKNKFLIMTLLIIFTITVFSVYGKNQIKLSIYNCTSIKGNVSLSLNGTVDEKIYHIPGSKFYSTLILKESEGDRCFRSEQEAIDLGFRKSKAF